MSQTPANIMAGPARIFIGAYSAVVLPVTGTPPTLFQHTDGTPSGVQTGFSDIGYTIGPVTFDYKSTKEEIIPEQSLAAVDVFVKEEMAQITFNAYERTFIAMRSAFDNVGTQSDATGDLFYAGGGQSIVTPLINSVFMSVRHRDNSAKFTWCCIYKAYSMDGVKLPFEKAKATQYQVTLKALVDLTRSNGDQLLQFKHEK